MAESRSKMLARLKAMRRKHGLGEFKKTRRQTTRVTRTMAKRKKSSSSHRRRSSGFGSKMSSWIPLSNRELMLDFGIGAAVGPISQFLAPYQAQYLGAFGQYSDEAALAIVGAVAHKMGSGLIKDGGKELFRVAVISAGQSAGSQLLGGSQTAGGGLNAYNY